MRIAVISDIHGNATALQQVLKDIDACGADLVFSLGDNIGYGPEPETVVNMLDRYNIPSVVGNHELAVIQPVFLEMFNPTARISIEKTVNAMSSETLSYISGLPYFLTVLDCRFVHGFPPDSVTRYMFELDLAEISGIMAKMDERICFIGHTHELALIEYRHGTAREIPLGAGVFSFEPDLKYIVNAGSVGQPRDGSGDAKYIIFDNRESTFEFRHVPYDVSDTVNKIHAAGLPRQHALRLLWS